MTKLWTGKTARQELLFALKINAAVNWWKITDSLEYVLDGAEKCPEGSPKREMLRWWDAADAETQIRLLSEARRIVKFNDRLAGRRITR